MKTLLKILTVGTALVGVAFVVIYLWIVCAFLHSS